LIGPSVNFNNYTKMPKKSGIGIETIEKECIVDIVYGSMGVIRKGSQVLEKLTSGTKVYPEDRLCWTFDCEWELRYS
jgi:hypothetical protein